MKLILKIIILFIININLIIKKNNIKLFDHEYFILLINNKFD